MVVKQQSKKVKVALALKLGKKAALTGLKRKPAYDKGLHPLYCGTPIGWGMPIMKSWLKGYDAAKIV